MDLDTLLSYQWGGMLPEFIIIITATLLSLLDLFLPKDKDRKLLAWIGLAGIVAALLVLFTQMGDPIVTILNDTYRLDSFSKAFKLILLVGTAFVFLLSMDYSRHDIEHRGEFYYLFLTALLGAMMMASSADIITLFVGLELLSISSYILAGLKKKNMNSNEAAFKYVVNGGISTAVILFGMSYIYGFTGETNLFNIQAALQGPLVAENSFLIIFAFFLLFIGLSFKIATAPFHMWAPDVYQGAPTPVTAFLSIVSKTAGFVIILRTILTIFISAPGLAVVHDAGINTEPLLVSIQPYISVLAMLTMIIGNAIAIRQHNIKRMLAYSSVAHAGYLLVPLASLSALVFEATWFYLIAYLFMTLGAFAVVQHVAAEEKSEEIHAFSGLMKRSPLLALSMSVFLLSLAGIPLTAGFVGKYEIFMSALGTAQQHYILAAVMIGTTIISYFYYFNIMVQMFFRPGNPVLHKRRIPAGVSFVLVLCIIGTIGFGILPGIPLDFIQQNFNFNEFFAQP
ncbi:NADH-quinone oxidoreductase subunit NuoN [Pseudalkalibacillus caeni]|uniref:NADH-quinone oxidoreductase subunit N n=1 Tax=Exobacillus caeni TaxID=2574798 RepID=A0A5R9F2Q8_9BACL|nr:NADH-quinone oxidoreductase subunit NuoN [Pseudalkalibacillus caeni]TLS35818.1 NADH-quinone oxidoreductase subunit NuoN [Pseudalkalibacillus caeni]